MVQRRALIVVLCFLAFTATVVFGAILLLSLKPTDAALKGGVTKVRLDDILEGESRLIETVGGPVYVIHRSDYDIRNIALLSDVLRDPNSEKSIQPAFAKNIYRSEKPEWLVVHALTGTSKTQVKIIEVLPIPYQGRVSWHGGLYDEVNGSLFDMAGRVYFLGHPKEQNLLVPDHKYTNDNTVEISPVMP